MTGATGVALRKQTSGIVLRDMLLPKTETL
jgi:hypothetical protein